MDKEISHEGIVESIQDGVIEVRINQASACNGCKVAAHCHASESKEKLIAVHAPDDMAKWQVGQAVTVTTQSSMAGRALLLAFGVPLLLMLLALTIALAAGSSEGVAALLALGVLLPYYLVLWFFRHRIGRDITFEIKDRQ